MGEAELAFKLLFLLLKLLHRGGKGCNLLLGASLRPLRLIEGCFPLGKQPVKLKEPRFLGLKGCKLRRKGAPIKLICACPYEGFEERWESSWQNRYQEILNEADLVRYICPEYSTDCFQIRNEWMVNHAARVIAVFNNKPSGTMNTIEYAIRQNVPVEFIKG